MALCCPQGRGCNSPERSEPCLLDSLRNIPHPQIGLRQLRADRPGIVGELTAHLHTAGCNILDSRMVNLRGEFAMIKAASQNGWIDERRVTMEVLTGIRRAGADMIITYFAPDVASWLRDS